MARNNAAIAARRDFVLHRCYHVAGCHRGTVVNLAKLRAIVEDPRTERVVMAFIIINAITLGLQTSKSVMDAIGPLLLWLDDAILAVFVVELAARIIVYRLSFFRDPWSVFDFIVVAIALVPASETFSVLRALRILRALRLITAVPALKAVVAGLLAALPGMGSIVLLIGLLYYVFAVIAVKLYGEAFPELFGTLGRSFFTLFTVMTLEGWVEVVKSMVEQFPYVWLFFVTFIIVTTFMVLNLFIGVVVNAMQKEHEKEFQQELDAERDIVHEEAAPILREVKELRSEVAELRKAMGKS
jgi:voltage-gated sodium channel